MSRGHHTGDKHINVRIKTYPERSHTLSKIPGSISALLDSSTDPLLSVVRAHTTFHIYPYFPQELPWLHQVPSTTTASRANLILGLP